MRSRKRGSFLIEAMLAIFLLAALIGYYISAFIVARHASKLSRERIIVSNLLREYMESYLSVDYSAIEVASPPPTDIDINDGVRTFPAKKKLECSLGSDILITDIYGYKKIYTKITWNGGISGNKQLTEEMVMYVTKK